MRFKSILFASIVLTSICSLTQSASAMYIAAMGRFAQRDPVRYASGMSLYEDVASNPIVGFDPLGLQGSTSVPSTTPPPDAETLGNTWCNVKNDPALPSVVVEILVPKDDCRSDVINAHEKVHVNQDSPCCEKAREAYRNAKTDAERKKIVDRWNSWVDENRDFDEYEASFVGANEGVKWLKAHQCDQILGHPPDPSPGESDADYRKQYDSWLKQSICCQMVKNLMESEAFQWTDHKKKYEAKHQQTQSKCPFD